MSVLRNADGNGNEDENVDKDKQTAYKRVLTLITCNPSAKDGLPTLYARVERGRKLNNHNI